MLLATWRPTSPSLAPMSAGSGMKVAGGVVVVVVVVVVEVARLRICVREEIALLIVSRSKLGSNWGAAVGDNYIYNIYTGLLKMCVVSISI